MPAILSASITRSAPMFLSAICLSASNTESPGAMLWTACLAFDLRISAAVFMERLLSNRTIGRQGDEARVLHGSAHGEVIERLKARVCEPEHLVNRVVEEAAYACGPHTGGFGFQIKHLADDPCLPEEPAIEPRPVSAQGTIELRDHRQRKSTRASDVLAAAELGGQSRGSALVKQEEGQAVGTARRWSPVEVWMHGTSKWLHLCRVTRKQVKTADQALYTMHEDGEVNGRAPWQNVPGHGTCAHLSLHSRHDAREHLEKGALRNGGCAVESERTASLADDLGRARPLRIATGGIVVRVNFTRSRAQVDDVRFRARLPRRRHHLIENFPSHWLASTQPVRLAAPDASRRIANCIGGERHGQTIRSGCRSAGRLVRRPDDGHAIRMLSLRVLKVLGASDPQQGGQRVVGHRIHEQHAPAQRSGCDAQAADGVPHVVLAVAKG